MKPFERIMVVMIVFMVCLSILNMDLRRALVMNFIFILTIMIIKFVIIRASSYESKD